MNSATQALGSVSAGGSMGYRGTRGQLEARLAALPAELSAMDERLADASRRVEVLREQQWGRLGVLWFRFTLRRALRDVDASARHNGTLKGLAKAIERHERALEQGQDVLRWLDDSLAPAEEERRPSPERPSPVGGALRDGLAVVGAIGRNVWAFGVPILMVLSLILSIAAAFGDADFDPPEDIDEDYEPDRRPPMAPEERHAADVAIGRVVMALGALFSVGGVGLWWWLR